MDKPNVKLQGAAVCEHVAHGEYLVMLPDGTIRGALDKKHAEDICRKWFAKHLQKDAIGVGTIEWRN